MSSEQRKPLRVLIDPDQLINRDGRWPGGEPAVLDVSAVGDGYRAAICLTVPTAGSPS